MAKDGGMKMDQERPDDMLVRLRHSSPKVSIFTLNNRVPFKFGGHAIRGMKAVS